MESNDNLLSTLLEIFVYACIAYLIYYLILPMFTSESTGECGCKNKNKLKPAPAFNPDLLSPADKACIAVGMCDPTNKLNIPHTKLSEWKALVVDTSKLIFKDTRASKQESKRQAKRKRK